MKGLIAAAVATAGVVVVWGRQRRSRRPPRTDVILAGSERHVDYHAEAAPAPSGRGGATIIGGNIQIVERPRHARGRGGRVRSGPRFGSHPRPEDDGCEWASRRRRARTHRLRPSHPERVPGEGGELPLDTDTSPNGAFEPVGTQTRENFNGRGGLDRDGILFMDDRPVPTTRT